VSVEWCGQDIGNVLVSFEVVGGPAKYSDLFSAKRGLLKAETEWRGPGAKRRGRGRLCRHRA